MICFSLALLLVVLTQLPILAKGGNGTKYVLFTRSLDGVQRVGTVTNNMGWFCDGTAIRLEKVLYYYEKNQCDPK